MNAQRSLSAFWRHNRTEDRAQELASVLQGADSLIGNMGSDIRVTWSGGGVSFTDLQRRIVALDYGPLKEEECPFPGTVVDEVIGYAAHEGGHCLWSNPWREEALKQLVHTRWSDLPHPLRMDWQASDQAVMAALRRIQNVLEDSYVDQSVSKMWPVLGEYIRIARRRLYERTPMDMDAIAGAAQPDRNAFMNLWVGLSLYGQALPRHTSPRVKQALETLLALSQRAAGEGNAEARQAMVAEAAIILYRQFPVKESPLPVSSKGGDGVSDDRTGKVGNLEDFDPGTGPMPCGRQVAQVPAKLLEQVAEVTDCQSQDLSQSVAEVLAEDPRQVAARATRATYDPGLAESAISCVRREIREVQEAFRLHQNLNARWLHGLSQGRLDDRRLWKPFVGDPGYYKRRDSMAGSGLDVGLLLDVSRSMKAHMPMVQQTAAVFSQGLERMPEIDFAVWCYTGHSSRVALTRICDRQLPRLCLADVQQGEGTPSGAAIAGCKVLMERQPRNMKRRLLIHFTDGHPDSDAHVVKAVRACRDADIHVYAIGLAQHWKMLVSQYGEGNCEAIQSVSDFPKAAARIVMKLGAYRR
ncbi:MAG: hypothetical protein HW388_1190 [Dehalococcoidia bacterium]|nr:hypothetical protein [Dehalococcoidia bacterium]